MLDRDDARGESVSDLIRAAKAIVKIMNVTMNVNIDDIHAIIYLYNFSVTI